MRFTEDSVTSPNNAEISAGEATPTRKRMGTAERKRQILDSAIQFFARNGIDGQLRNLSKELGITHTLLYHYFPTKDALIQEVYKEVFSSSGSVTSSVIGGGPNHL